MEIEGRWYWCWCHGVVDVVDVVNVVDVDGDSDAEVMRGAIDGSRPIEIKMINSL
jgi:hypothetical protein